MLRFAPNYVFLQADSAKKAEAEALAATLCTLLAVPAIIDAAAQMILLAWAYGESVVDIRSLLKGNKVPLVKTGESWQLQLAGVFSCGSMYQQGGAFKQVYIQERYYVPVFYLFWISLIRYYFCGQMQVSFRLIHDKNKNILR